jgi:hypothetical protein
LGGLSPTKFIASNGHALDVPCLRKKLIMLGRLSAAPEAQQPHREFGPRGLIDRNFSKYIRSL